MNVLTMDELSAMSPGQIIASGTVTNTSEPGKGLNLTPFRRGDPLRWIAQKHTRGWVICIYWTHEDGEEVTDEMVLRDGDQLTLPSQIEYLVPCTAETLDEYQRTSVAY